MNYKDLNNNNRTLGVLSAVEADSRVTQRSLASELGIALGLTNSYFKKCIDKGLVKIKQVPANRYAYYLTPRGFSEKSRLTTEYFKTSFSFYRRAKKDLINIVGIIGKSSNKNINGIPIKADIKFFKEFDKVILTNIDDSKSRYEELSKVVPIDKIIIPDILKFTNKSK